MSTSTKPPLSVGKARTETAVQKPARKKPTSSSPAARHKEIQRSSSFSVQDKHSSSRAKSSGSDDTKSCKSIEIGSSNSAIINRMEREIDVSFFMKVVEINSYKIMLQARLERYILFYCVGSEKGEQFSEKRINRS